MRRLLAIVTLTTILGGIYLNRLNMQSRAYQGVSAENFVAIDTGDSIQEVAMDKQALEKRILEATLRIEIEAWLVVSDSADENGLLSYVQATGNGHGTIQDGRYLVTHNHYGIPLEALESGLAYAYGAVSFYTASGEKLAIDISQNSFTVLEGGQETLIFDFGVTDGIGVLAANGLPSAQFKSWNEIAMQPGTEVAQVDWDGVTSRVDWVEIEEIIIDDGLPRLVLSGGLTPGSSGGGVYWNGYHIANNWKYVETFDGQGDTLELVSIGVLDPINETIH